MCLTRDDSAPSALPLHTDLDVYTARDILCNIVAVADIMDFVLSVACCGFARTLML